MNIANATAKRISQLLIEKNKTQYKLRQETCLSEKTLIGLLHNRTKDVNSSTVFLIASAFGLSLKEFYDSPLFDAENIEA